MQLKRVLGARDAAWLVAGNMIGAGIFYTPGLVAGRLPGLAAPLFAWGLGGLLALCGAAVYGELGARFPRAGGDYQYLTHAFGPMWGFLTGWAAFLLTFAAATAAMILVVLDYLGRAVPWLAESGWTHPWLAGPLLALILTVANVAGARVAGKTTALMTGVPLLGILILFGGGLLFGEARIVWPEVGAGPQPNWSVALGAAMIPIFFSYTGWNVAAYVAGEVREPARNLARGLIGGTLAVTLVYLLINLTFLLTVPQSELAGSTTAGADAVRRLLGPEAERLLSIIVALAVLGTANVTMMAGSRIYFAMAADGLAPRSMGRVNRAGVPAGALWISGIWTGFLTVIGGVESLVNWATLAILLLSSLTVGALFVFRRRDADLPAYVCPLYPLTPLIYLATCLAVALASVVDGPLQALIGVAIVATGIPVYFVVRHLGAARGAG